MQFRVQADVSKSEDVDAAVRNTLAEFGRIDILVNNAGIAGRTLPLTDLEETDWDEVIGCKPIRCFLML